VQRRAAVICWMQRMKIRNACASSFSGHVEGFVWRGIPLFCALYHSRKAKLHHSHYTDRETAACRRSDCQICGYRVPSGQRDGSLRPYSRFSRQEPLLFYQVAPQLYSRGCVDPFQTHYFFLSGSGGNRTRASGSVAKNSDH
jgi:hypothetical protein